MAVRLRRALIPLVAVAILEGCGQSVPVKATYYFPKARTSIVVTETLSCTASGVLMTSLVVNPTTEYIRDDSAYATIYEKEFGGTFSDPDVTITYTGDGRLLGINASTTGEGPAIIKGVVSVAAAVVSTTLLSLDLSPFKSAPPSPKPSVSLCDLIKEVTAQAAAPAAPVAPEAPPAKKKKGSDDQEKDAVVSIIYSADFEYYFNGTDTLLRDISGAVKGMTSPRLEITPSPESTSIYAKLNLSGEPHSAITVAVEETQSAPQSRITLDTTDKPQNGESSHDKTIRNLHVPNFSILTVNKATGIRLVVTGPDGGMTATRDLWRGDVSVPIAEYEPILIPTGGAFGTHSFSATFAADGQLGMIQYKSSGTASQTLDALNDALGAVPKKKEKETAGRKADDIHDANRLRLCLADPTNCPAN